MRHYIIKPKKSLDLNSVQTFTVISETAKQSVLTDLATIAVIVTMFICLALYAYFIGRSYLFEGVVLITVLLKAVASAKAKTQYLTKKEMLDFLETNLD